MERRLILRISFVSAVLALVAAGGFIVWRLPASVNPPTQIRPPIADKPPEPISVPSAADQLTGLPPVTPPETAPKEEMPHLEVHPADSRGYRRFEFVPTIGDVMRIAYYRPTAALFMAVTELDGQRSIWRLNADRSYDRVLTENSRPGDIFLAADSRNRLYAQFDDPGTLYRSEDGGANWKPVADRMGGTFWTIADDGQGTIWGTQHAENTAILYRSTDDGLTWEPWKDFQKIYPEFAVTYAADDPRFKLRHLHAVAYLQGELFVGTGDVARFTAMSDDGGKTWRKVWGEGFTASVPTAEGDALLMGPDRLRAHGIARFHVESGKTTEVWSPIPYGYAGYTYSMIQSGHVYLVAFHTETNEVRDLSSKTGIVASPDTVRLYPYLEVDSLNNNARTDMFLENGPTGRVFMSRNGSLFDFAPMDRWTFDMLKPFGK